ncbi:MAG: aspartate aminotransferase family protein [Gammaproteobacteria bacterium]|nr:aspartate aminotransferase family protein [Gammaproteobacteria bacterium]
MANYSRLPVSFRHGKGCWLWDDAGEKYLDALSGIAVCGLGHTHPAVSQAIKEQADLLLHTSNLYNIEPQLQLATKLNALCATETAFFCNSGAEANEAAIKIARRYGHDHGINNAKIIVMDGAFHGRTLATLSATGNNKIKQGFGPLVEGFIQVPYNDINAVSTHSNESNVVAVMVEPIQGESGINIPNEHYLSELRKLCDKNEWLLMTDEIQSGIGRTGHWLAAQRVGVSADVVTLAKGLANGVPIGACLARGKAAKVFGPGSHGSTFGGNPLACRAALAVINTIEDDELMHNASTMGNYLLNGFKTRLSNLAIIKEIRGQGLLIGIELNKPCAELISKALSQHLLINVTAERVIRLLPPLILQQTEADMIIDTVSELIVDFAKQV